MRILDRQARSARFAGFAMMVGFAILVAACGGPAPSSAPPAPPTPTPIPSPTPIAHLGEPATADQVYLALRAAGFRIEGNTASTAGEGLDPIKVIQATYDGWPLAIGQWGTATDLKADVDWKAGVESRSGRAPFEFLGLNIIVQWGPIASRIDVPDAEKTATAVALRDALTPLIAPVSTRTFVTLPKPPAQGGAELSPGPSSSLVAR